MLKYNIWTFILESLKIVHLVWDANVFIIKADVFMTDSCNCVKGRQCSTRPWYKNKVFLMWNKVGHCS
jgi:hypothetical protein